ncbi:MAG: NAD(P)-dependent oxidoreductase [Actinomycetota bacterium]|nr:NAD(P)-dependent oxidoreductase [Actinomycetota bacterium]
MSSIAVIGLGAMGGRIAARLLASGHELAVWNRTPGRADRLVARGARAAGTPADAVRSAETVITMVADADALAAVTEGESGIFAGARGGVTMIEMSTVGPAAISRLAARLPPAVGLLDAPVLGSLPEAESGELVIFVGGDHALVERARPLLGALGSPLHVGPVGAGAAAKLVANSTLFGVLGLIGEALALARGLGLSREAAFQVLTATPVAAQFERRRPAIESGEYPLRFSLSLAHKDAELVAEAAEAGGVRLSLADVQRARLREAERAGWGARDYSAVLAWILHESGGDHGRADEQR